MPKVAIVIVNWNGKDDTVVCLDSLKKLDRRGCNLEVIIVDNGSTNDSVAVIKKAHPWVILLETGKNLGFTGGNNVGIDYTFKHHADFVWLLNNDTIVKKDALTLVDAFKETDVGVAGSKIYFVPGWEFHGERYQASERGKVIWFAGGLIDWANMYASHRGVDEVDHGQYDTPGDTQFITGCSLMVRPKVFEKVGLLDDKFYLYLEDLDFCQRAKRAGFRLLYFPKSVVWHVNAGSSGGAGNPLHEYYLSRNRLLVGFRYAPFRTKLALLREGMRFVVSGSSIKQRAVLDALFGRWGKQYEPKKFRR